MSSSSSFSLPYKFNSLQLSRAIIFLFLTIIARFCLAIPANDRRRLPDEESPISNNHCDFDEELKTYEPHDFLRCVDDLAKMKNSVKFEGGNPPPILSDRLNRLVEALQPAEESSYRFYSRQRFGPYGSYDQVPGVGPRPFRPERPISDGFPVYFNGLYDAPRDDAILNSPLIEALTSISRYDDLKCVPRLLCEISTGSKPGDGNYRASTLENFGKSTLIGLLTSYNFERASPLLGFAKAALLGYTSKDDASICYQEYRRCPREQRDLIHYLNNHNGGFFRFFKNSHRENRIVEGSNRAAFAGKEPAPPPGLSGPESDRTGTGELKFDNSEPSPRQEDKTSALSSREDAAGTRVVFPEVIETGYRVPKSLEPNRVTPGFFPVSESPKESRKSSFFPPDGETENDYGLANIVTFENDDEDDDDEEDSIDHRHRDSASNYGENKERPHRASDAVETSFKFPDEVISKVIFDSEGRADLLAGIEKRRSST